MRLFVDLWSDPLITERTPAWSQKEQDALTYLIINHPFLLERVGFVPQRLINSYARDQSMWKRGDLLVHFAGCWSALLNTFTADFFSQGRLGMSRLVQSILGTEGAFTVKPAGQLKGQNVGQ
jgi:hypothetical protein